MSTTSPSTSYLPRGTVYGTLLNFSDEVEALRQQMDQPPYKAPPRAPVLYVKPANTWSASGADVPVPARTAQVEVGATIGMVMAEGRQVAGYVLMADFSVPHASFFRPPVKSRCPDGFLGVGPQMREAAEAGDPAGFRLEVRINGELRQTVDFSHLVRDATTLLAAVSEFMTLHPGDVLMLGCDAGRPLAAVGDRIRIDAPGFATLASNLVAERVTTPPNRPPTAAAGRLAKARQARVVHQGQTYDATEHDGQLLLADGRTVAFDEVQWLAPFAPTPRPRTILALGLNYADHARELEFKAPEEPLVFIKGESSLTGHRRQTMRPDGVKFMHYECELVIVIGRTARNVKRAHAADFIAGYTVANDYAIRDYLENWYRPNLRVKNRDACTPIGPWLVPAGAVADPMALELRTTVNGRPTQSGNTRDMIFDIPFLIEYFSGFMTLSPGDLILTGTPDGVIDCQPGDVVVTEIDGIGALVNTIRAETSGASEATATATAATTGADL